MMGQNLRIPAAGDPVSADWAAQLVRAVRASVPPMGTRGAGSTPEGMLQRIGAPQVLPAADLTEAFSVSLFAKEGGGTGLLFYLPCPACLVRCDETPAVFNDYGLSAQKDGYYTADAPTGAATIGICYRPYREGDANEYGTPERGQWCLALLDSAVKHIDGSDLQSKEFPMFHPVAYFDGNGKLYQLAKGPWNAYQPAVAPWKEQSEMEKAAPGKPVIAISPAGESEGPMLTLDGFDPAIPPLIQVKMEGAVEQTGSNQKQLRISWAAQDSSASAGVSLLMRAELGGSAPVLQYINTDDLELIIPMEDIAAAIEPPYDPRIDYIIEFIDDIKNKPCNHPESGGMSFYGWDPCYTDPETGETGRWVDATSPAAGADLPFWLRDGDSATNMGSSIGNTTDGTVIDLDHYILVGEWSTDVLTATRLSSSETISTRDLDCEKIGSVSNKLAINAESTFGLGIITATLTVAGTKFVPTTLQYLKPDGTTASITVLAAS